MPEGRRPSAHQAAKPERWMMNTSTQTHPIRRWPILLPCILAMLAIANLQYAWTFFTTDITKSMHAPLDAVQWTLTFFIIAQTVLFPINAYLIDRFGPRLIVTIASVLVAIGWIGAGKVNSLPALYLVYAIGGIGAGAVYGGCGGVPVEGVSGWRGLCVGGGLAAQFLRMPAPGWVPAGWEAIKAKVKTKVQQSTRDYTPGEMVRSKSFHLLYLMMTLVTASGLMLTAQLKPIGVTYGYDKYALFGGYTVLTLTSSLNQILNGSARPFFGWVSDRIGRYDTMAIVFVMEAITITILTLVVAHPFWFIAISGLMFFAWGDIYTLFPAAIADIFGSKHATTNYGIQYTAKGVGSILGGPAAAWLMVKAGSWTPVFWSAVLCNVIAAGLALVWLKPRVARVLREETEEPDSTSEPVIIAEPITVAKASD